MSKNINYRQLLEQSLREMRRMRAEIEAMEQSLTEPIAVVGMGCRLPGGSDTPETYWSMLREGVDTIGEVPTSRWAVDDYYDPSQGVAGKMYVREGGFLSNEMIDQFDPQFFGIAPREATALDPQQRLLLEVTWEALENAGISADSLHGTQTGVFVGLFWDDYSSPRLYSDPNQVDGYRMLSGLRSMAAGRLAYVLGLHGPAMQLDTACSSSLLAIHQACMSLRQKECDVALAGGVNLMLSPELSIAMCNMKALAPDGRSKAFDASANGFARGEGCGIVVLKRVSDALAAGDNILAVVRGSAVNHDGRSNGLSVPSGLAQERVIRQAQQNAGVRAEQIQYIETHGTGTPLGDPIEMIALGKAMAAKERDPFLIGSVKCNIGHLESAGGVAAFMKVVLALQHAEIPPHVHFKTPSPHIPWDEIPVVVPTETRVWSSESRIAGINSFGMSGTNVHMIVAQSPKREDISAESSPHQLLTLSAKNKSALRDLATEYADYLSTHPNIPLADICYTARAGRSQFTHRLAAHADNHSDLAAQLSSFAAGDATSAVIAGQVSGRARNKIVFVFTGQGVQYVEMGRDLYASEPLFRQTLDQCNEILKAHLSHPLLDVIFPTPDADAGLIDTSTYLQPAIFAIEVALATLWRSWGIEPDFVFGHSLGEFAAAWLAGVLTLEDGLRLVAMRGRLVDSTSRDGQMVAAMTSAEHIQTILVDHPDVSLAAINGPISIAISGARQLVQPVVEKLAHLEIKTKVLAIPVAPHSCLMDPILDALEAVVRTVKFTTPQLPFVSSMTGQLIDEIICETHYWREQLRHPVRFLDGIEALYEQGCNIFIEVGPKPALINLIEPIYEACAERTGNQHVPPTVLASLNPKSADWPQLLQSVGTLYTQGVSVNDAAFGKHRKVILPTYPFQRQRYWSDVPRNTQTTNALRPLIDQMTQSPRLKETIFETMFSVETMPFLNDHHVYGEIVSPGACQLAMVLHGAELALGQPQPRLKDIVFPAALMIPAQGERQVQLILTPENDATTFEVLSVNDAGDPPTHVMGQIESYAALLTRLPNWLQQIQARCQTSRSVSTLYETIAAQNIALGEHFRWVTALWQGNNELLGQLRLPDVVNDFATYTLHPGLLDACFHLTVATYDDADKAETLIPFAIEAINLYASAQGDNWWGHVRQVAPHKWNIDLMDHAGQLIAEIKGFEVRSVAHDAILRQSRGQDWLYQTAWREQPLDFEVVNDHPPHLLVFADSDKQIATVYKGRATFVAVGEQFKQIDAYHYQINPTRPADYQRLLTCLSDVAGVIYLWSIDTMLPQSADAISTVTERNCGSALLLIQAMIDAGMEFLPLQLVTRGAQAVDSADSINGLFQSPLWGLGKVIDHEFPDFPCTRIDLDLKTSVTALLNELATDVREPEVAYRNGKRHVARLTRHTPSHTPLEIHPDGSYLVVGGLGDLGLLVAQRLIDMGAQRLILMGRSQPRSAVQQQLAKMRQQGVEVVIAQADVADQAQVARVLVDEPLCGIVHAAGVVDDGILLQQTWARFEVAFRPKVAGIWNLHTLTQHLPLDFFIMFSSIASILGASGQANYAAANAFVDAFAAWRRAQGLTALSINWGGWSEVGFAARSNVAVRNDINFIAPEDGVQVFERLLSAETAQVGVLPINWSNWQTQTPFVSELIQSTNSVSSLATFREQLDAESAENKHALLATFVRSQVAQIVGWESGESIALADGFFQIGMDSLMAMQLRNALQTSLACQLPSTLTFKYPTVETLINYLSDELFGSDAESAEEVFDVDAKLQAELEAELDDLDEDELAQMLADIL